MILFAGTLIALGASILARADLIIKWWIVVAFFGIALGLVLEAVNDVREDLAKKRYTVAITNIAISTCLLLACVIFEYLYVRTLLVGGSDKIWHLGFIVFVLFDLWFASLMLLIGLALAREAREVVRVNIEQRRLTAASVKLAFYGIGSVLSMFAGYLAIQLLLGKT